MEGYKIKITAAIPTSGGYWITYPDNSLAYVSSEVFHKCYIIMQPQFQTQCQTT